MYVTSTYFGSLREGDFGNYASQSKVYNNKPDHKLVEITNTPLFHVLVPPPHTREVPQGALGTILETILETLLK